MEYNNKILKLTYVVTNIIAVVGIAVFLLIPFLVKLYITNVSPIRQIYSVQTIAVLMISAALAVSVLLLISKLSKNVLNKKAFENENARLLNYIGFLCMAIAFVYLIAIFLFLKLVIVVCTSVVIVTAFLLMGLVCFSFSKLFYRAVEYKKENDLTI